jgi:hypothetical protein
VTRRSLISILMLLRRSEMWFASIISLISCQNYCEGEATLAASQSLTSCWFYAALA